MKRTHRGLGITLLAGAWLGLSAIDAPGRLPMAVAQDCVSEADAGAGETEDSGRRRSLDLRRGDRGTIGEPLRFVADWRVGAYRVTVDASGVDQVLTVWRGLDWVHHQKGQSFQLASVREGGRLVPLVPGRDVTGDGKPDLAIFERTGGAHCTNRMWIFELGATVHRLPPIDAAHDGVAFFEDVDGDGRLEFRTHDWTFANWRTAFAFSPAPEVILSASGGALRPNWSLTSPPAGSLDHQVAEVHAEPDWSEGEVPPTLWGHMLDWIYGGSPGEAWTLLARAWPAETPGRDAFERAFRAQLAQSPYWSDLAPRLK